VTGRFVAVTGPTWRVVPGQQPDLTVLRPGSGVRSQLGYEPLWLLTSDPRLASLTDIVIMIRSFGQITSESR
jgi:hypothetical protein